MPAALRAVHVRRSRLSRAMLWRSSEYSTGIPPHSCQLVLLALANDIIQQPSASWYKAALPFALSLLNDSGHSIVQSTTFIPIPWDHCRMQYERKLSAATDAHRSRSVEIPTNDCWHAAKSETVRQGSAGPFSSQMRCTSPLAGVLSSTM
jgi:hypothetical protein